MASNSKYDNNIILKEEAFQNLLTNIKKYPIVDIDAIEWDETDELHGDNIWLNYSHGAPCIKLTYGDTETTKGNVIFAAADLRREIRQLKRDIQALGVQRNDLISQQNRWKAIYNENYKVYLDKGNQVRRLQSQFESISENKLKFLKAGWDVLFLSANLNIDDHFEQVPSSTEYDSTVNYYTKASTDHYNIFNGTLVEWQEELNNGNIYIESNNDKGPIVTEYLGPESFTYYSIALNQRDNPSIKVTAEYTRLNDGKAKLLSDIDRLVNRKDSDGETDYFNTQQKELLNQFRDFINKYNNLAFLDAVGLAGYTEEDIEELKENGPEEIKTIINTLEAENAMNWEDYSSVSQNFNVLCSNFEAQIETIVNRINTIIYDNLTFIQSQVDALGNEITQIDQQITQKQEQIIQDEQGILDAAANAGGSNRTMYGYKYVTVGDHIEWKNYDTPSIVTNNNSNQASGTFRIKVNNDIYEVPVKGFGEQSNKNISMSTSGNISGNASGNIGFSGSTASLSGSSSVGVSGGSVSITGSSITASSSGALSLSGTTDTITGNTSIGINGGSVSINGSSITASSSGALSLSGTNASVTITNAINLSTSNLSTTASGNVNLTGKSIELYCKSPSDSGATGWVKINNKDVQIATPSMVNGGSVTIGAYGNGSKLTLSSESVSIGKSFDSSVQVENDLSVIGTIETDLCPQWNNTYNSPQLGTKSNPWHGAAIKSIYCESITATYKVQFNCPVYISGTTSFTGSSNSFNSLTASSASITNLTVTGSLSAPSTESSDGNDYAEFRKTIALTPGHVVIDQDDGSLSCSTKRLQPGAQIISDTYAMSVGKDEEYQTPLGVIGRVLAYPYQDRKNYHAGMAVCSAPDGKVDIMTREEIRNYPDCIIGIVSEIPNYEIWEKKNIKVDGRIWIKIK